MLPGKAFGCLLFSWRRLLSEGEVLQCKQGTVLETCRGKWEQEQPGSSQWVRGITWVVVVVVGFTGALAATSVLSCHCVHASLAHLCRAWLTALWQRMAVTRASFHCSEELAFRFSDMRGECRRLITKQWWRISATVTRAMEEAEKMTSHSLWQEGICHKLE